MKYVYIAGPITLGNQFVNVRRGILAADEVLNAGHYPFCPHLSGFWECTTGRKSAETWLTLDFAWLAKCDAMIRLPGESEGADKETKFARKHGIPVFDTVEAFLGWAKDEEVA